MSAAALRTLAAMSRELREAREQAHLAYKYNPTSYTYRVVSSCSAAMELVDSYREYIRDMDRDA